jgi:hypothetical protein
VRAVRHLLSSTAVAAVLTFMAAMGLSPGDADARAPAFGVISQTELDNSDYRRMRRSGVRVIRVWLPWSSIEAERGAGFDFSGTDELVAAAARHRLRVVGMLFGTPDWVARQLDGRRCGECVAYAPRRQQARLAWGRFAAAAAARYGHRGAFWAEHPAVRYSPVRDWQIWNEPNSRDFYAPAPNPRAYSRLVRRAGSAIARADRSARVILGGMAELAGSRRAMTGHRFLARLYRTPRARRSFDSVAVHPYASRVGATIDQIEAFRATMRDAGDRNAGLWVTEMGWSSKRSSHPLDAGPRGQARNLSRTFKYLRANRGRLRLRGALWFSWADSRRSVCEWCRRSGLVTGAHGKPALRAFRRSVR